MNYTLKIDHPLNEDDIAEISLYDGQYNEKDYFFVYQDEKIQYTVAKGDKIHISYLAGTMRFKEILPQSIKVSKSSFHITNNQTVKVTATISPANASDKTVIWKSSNTKVATVDSKGNIKGLANGSATITAAAKANPNVLKKYR